MRITVHMFCSMDSIKSNVDSFFCSNRFIRFEYVFHRIVPNLMEDALTKVYGRLSETLPNASTLQLYRSEGHFIDSSSNGHEKSNEGNLLIGR